MRTAVIAFIAVFAFANNGISSPPQDDLVKKLTEVIRKQCPDAEIAVTKDSFVAKNTTLTFTLHGRYLTGEINPQTHQEEGPNLKGFRLEITLHQGPYVGMAAVPQVLEGPYFPTFIDAPATDDGKQHYWIRFAYGKGLDPVLKKAILEAIPRTQTPKPDGAAKP